MWHLNHMNVTTLFKTEFFGGHTICLGPFFWDMQYYTWLIETNDNGFQNLLKIMFKAAYSVVSNYRLITAYLLLQVDLDKIMHARWDFDASSAQTQRVSALDKHQNQSGSVLFCLNSQAKSKYAVINLIHTRSKRTF